ncbi:hypothetical protein ACFHW2_25200 [Actinomadura sp. LOL_016]|uniref:hypothetical protein n=1 Tax=unclassified Actinomadura TaxID=2626254 RepID=UPI003A80577F
MQSDLLVIIGLISGSAAIAGVVSYLLTRRDFPGWSAVLVAAAAAVLVGAASIFTLYLAPFAFLVAAAAYLVIRRLFRAGPALIGATLTLFGGLAASVLMIFVALSTM